MGARSSSTGERDRPCHSAPPFAQPPHPSFSVPIRSSLQNLNLRLNRLGDEGGKLLLEGLLENSTLTQLNLSCNALEFDAATTTRQIVATSTALRNLDLSCNLLSEEAGRLLREGLQQNGTLQSLALRQNQMSLDTVAAVDEVCKRNQLEYDKQRRDVRERASARQGEHRGRAGVRLK